MKQKREVKVSFGTLADAKCRLKPDCYILRRGGLFAGTTTTKVTKAEMKTLVPCQHCH